MTAAASCFPSRKTAAAARLVVVLQEAGQQGWKSRPAVRSPHTREHRRRKDGRRAVCRRCNRTPAVVTPIRGPDTPRRGTESRATAQNSHDRLRPERRIDRISRPSAGSDRSPQARAMTSAAAAWPCRSGCRRSDPRRPATRRSSPDAIRDGGNSVAACRASRESRGRGRGPAPPGQAGLYPLVIARLAGQVFVRAVDVVFQVRPKPRMVEGD